MASSRMLLAWQGAGQGSGKDLLAAGAGIVPEGMNKGVVCAETLIIPDKLQPILINRGIHRRVPTLGGDADIVQK